MAQDYGILITEPGTDVTGAPRNRTTLNTSYPFIKIDTQNAAGFKTILLVITTNPPEPVFPVTDRYTTVASFAHGYTYKPSVEALFYVTSIAPGVVGGQTYFQDNGFLGGHTVDDGVYLYAVADATNVYIIVDKFNDGAGMANVLTGTNVQITVHVFVEDIGS